MSRAAGFARLVPGPAAVVFWFWLVAVPLVHQPRLLNGDGDLARHLRHGQWILEHGTVIRQDPFSLTHAGRPFVGFEYGSQVMYALAHRAAGLAGVTALAVALIALASALVARFLLRRGVDPLLAFLGAMLAGVVAQIHYVARPHLVTFVLTVLLLEMLERPRRPPWWVFAFFFVAWANLHAGVLFGLVVVGIYLAAAVVEGLDSDRWHEAWGRMRGFGLILLVGTAALFVTPYGADGPTHIAHFFGDRYLRERTSEFFSPSFHWAGMKPFLAVLLGTVLAFGWSRGRVPLSSLLVITATIGFALLAQRNVSLFAYTGLPLLLLHLDGAWKRLPDPRGLRAGFARGASQATDWPWIAIGALLVGAIAANEGRVRSVQVLANRFDRYTFPVDLVEHARAREMKGRYFHEFTWGGYLLYAWPGQPIFIDGGTDFFGGSHLRSFPAIRGMWPGWRDSLRAYDIDHALLGVRTPLAHELARDPGWGLVRCDVTGVLLSRSAPRAAAQSDSLASCHAASRAWRPSEDTE
ncbi:MAG: hypothetical protein ACREMH_09445 [Gemmatimonadales bacterium]